MRSEGLYRFWCGVGIVKSRAMYGLQVSVQFRAPIVFIPELSLASIVGERTCPSS